MHARRLAVALAGVAALGAVALLWAIDPAQPGSPFPGCLFYRYTGLYCPGCGMTRMLHALLHGDVARAASLNLFGLVALPALALMLLHQSGRLAHLPRGVSRVLYDGRLWLAAIAAFAIARNLPWAPFSALAPA